MYSWAGQLYTALITVHQGIKGMSAGLTGFPGEKIAYIFLPTRDFYMPTNLTNRHELFAMNRMATCSVARIYTNSMSGELKACPVA